MALIDSHAHLDFYTDPEGSSVNAVLERARAAGVTGVLAIGIGDGPETMGRALEIAEGRDGVWASVGIHPQEAHQTSDEALARLKEIAGQEKCVAVGEIGLDYYHVDNPSIDAQKEAFVAQMKIAREVGKPILIHCRTSELARPEAKAKYGDADAWEDLLQLIGQYWSPGGLAGVMHCFSGSAEQARRSLAAGFYLSFAGNLTYPSPKSNSIREAALLTGMDRILVETDAPFLAPMPHRGKENEPALVVHTAAFLAELRGVSLAEIGERTTGNFRRLFPAATGSLGEV